MFMKSLTFDTLNLKHHNYKNIYRVNSFDTYFKKKLKLQKSRIN